MMTFGERLQFIRKHRGLTQKELGLYLGFSENTADIRIAQYELNERVPVLNLLKKWLIPFYHFLLRRHLN